jgi:hypothetical protein
MSSTPGINSVGVAPPSLIMIGGQEPAPSETIALATLQDASNGAARNHTDATLHPPGAGGFSALGTLDSLYGWADFNLLMMELAISAESFTAAP